jgi:hypothetical protein
MHVKQYNIPLYTTVFLKMNLRVRNIRKLKIKILIYKKDISLVYMV